MKIKSSFFVFLSLILTMQSNISFGNSIKESDEFFEKSGMKLYILNDVDLLTAFLLIASVKKKPTIGKVLDGLIKHKNLAENQFNEAAKLLAYNESFRIRQINKKTMAAAAEGLDPKVREKLLKNIKILETQTDSKPQRNLKKASSTLEAANGKIDSFKSELDAILKSGGTLKEVETLYESLLRRTFNLVKVSGAAIFVGNVVYRSYEFHGLGQSPSINPAFAWAFQKSFPVMEYIADKAMKTENWMMNGEFTQDEFLYGNEAESMESVDPEKDQKEIEEYMDQYESTNAVPVPAQ